MEVAIIAPKTFIDLYCRTPMQYCYPSWIVNSIEYREAYLNKKRRKDIIILDSVACNWKREPEDKNIVLEAFTVLEPDYLILPSITFDSKETIKLQLRLLEEWEDLDTEIVYCAEGADPESLKEYENFVRDRETRRIDIPLAIPSHLLLVKKYFDSKYKTIYLDLRDDPYTLDPKEVRLQDILITSLPIRLGLEGRLNSNYKPTPSPLDLEKKDDPFPMIVERNIKDLIEYYE